MLIFSWDTSAKFCVSTLDSPRIISRYFHVLDSDCTAIRVCFHICLVRLFVKKIQSIKEKLFYSNFIISYIFIIFAPELRFRSSVGLEQQPSKLWVLGSNPSEITERLPKSENTLTYGSFLR